VNTRLRLVVALVSIAIAVACVVESARDAAVAPAPVHIAEP
jgi:hypothetical protein